MATKKLNAPHSVGRQLNFTTGRMNALCQKRLDPYGLSLPQWVILSCLWREGELAVSTLSGLIGTGMPATSRLIDRMIERGLIARRRDPDDGRGALIKVTQQGQALDHLRDFHTDINAALLAGFSEQERSVVFELLERMEQNAAGLLD